MTNAQACGLKSGSRLKLVREFNDEANGFCLSAKSTRVTVQTIMINDVRATAPSPPKVKTKRSQ